MCGILATDKVTDVTREMLKYLAWEMELRGADSWGMTNGVWVDKWLGRITERWRDVELKDGEPLVAHTRTATVGVVAERNSHPWVIQKTDGRMVKWDETRHELEGGTEGCVVGVHNGCVRNYAAMKAKYAEVRKDWEVDSTHVFGHIALGLPEEEIEGYGALVWFDERALKLLRFHMTDLSVLEMDGGELVICSKRDAVVKAARMVGAGVKAEIAIKEGVEYEIVGGEVVEGAARRFGQGTTTSVVWNEAWGGAWRSRGQVVEDDGWTTQAGFCLRCRIVKLGDAAEAVCERCFKVEVEAAEREDRGVLVYGG